MEMRVLAATAEVRTEIQVKSLTALKRSCCDNRKPAPPKKQFYLVILSAWKLSADVFYAKI